MLQTVLFDIDTQYDFIDPNGKLYAKGAEEILPRLNELFTLAERQRYTTISTACSHVPDDPEFKKFAPHCIAGTPGQKRFMADRPKLPLRVISPAAKGGVIFETGIHYLVEKRELDPFSNPWLSALLKRGKLNHHQAIVFGVTTDYCVNFAIKGLLAAKIKTFVVTDAIKAIDPAAGERAMSEWRSNGATLLTTRELFEFFRWLGHMPGQGQESTVGTPRPKYPGHAPRH